MVVLFDSHAHLGDDALFPDIDNILERAKTAEIKHIINICTNIKTVERGLILSKKYPWVFIAAATTPHDAAKEGDEVFPYIEKLAKSGMLAAIGETGLDYFHYRETKDAQKHLFRRCLKLALECNLPLIIHCREAFADFFNILDSDYLVHQSHRPGILHCFTGTMEEAKEVIARGFYLSFSGIVTFKKSQALRDIVKMVPLDRLLIETDSPYLSPESRRSKTNEPAFIRETAQVIAEIKELSLEALGAATVANTHRFLR